MKKKIVFRVDGGANIGLGHLIRSMALAEMLKDEYSIEFYCKEAPDSVISQIIAKGFGYYAIQSEEDFFAIAKEVIVVLDGYNFGAEYQKLIKNQDCKLVCIDDLHDKEFFADLIINHSPSVKPEDYNAQPYTDYALGLNYALLRPAFLNAATIQKEENDVVETVFICFGGSDPLNLTLQTLNVVKQRKEFKKIIVVTGASYQHSEALRAIDDERLTCYSDLSEEKLCIVMQQSDLAIVPSSSILLEAIACGLQIITCYYVENQKGFHDAFHKLGISSLGYIDNFHNSLQNFFISSYFFSKTNQVRDMLAKSSNNYKLKFLTLSEERIYLLKANENNLETTYKWASDHLVRAFAFNTNEIDFTSHASWFKSKLEDVNCIYFIAFKGKNAIGSIRFDVVNDEAIISFLIDPAYHGMGFGKNLLEKGYSKIKECLDESNIVKRVVGYVLKKNVASIKTFTRAEYYVEELNDDTLKFYKEI